MMIIEWNYLPAYSFKSLWFLSSFWGEVDVGLSVIQTLSGVSTDCENEPEMESDYTITDLWILW